MPPEEFDSLLRVLQVTAVLSIIGSTFNIITTLTLKIHTTRIGKMIISLASADLIGNCFSLLIVLANNNESLCRTCYYFKVFGFVASGAITACLAHFLNVSIKSTPAFKSMKKYLLLSFGVATACGLLAALTNFQEINPNTGECVHYYINHKGKIRVSSLMIMVVYPIMAITVCAHYHLSTMKHIRRNNSADEKVLIFYPLILIFCYTPLGIVEILFEFNLVESIGYDLRLISTACSGLFGFFNALAYGISQKIISSCAAKCRKRDQDSHLEEVMKSALTVGKTKISLIDRDSDSIHQNLITKSPSIEI